MKNLMTTPWFEHPSRDRARTIAGSVQTENHIIIMPRPNHYPLITLLVDESGDDLDHFAFIIVDFVFRKLTPCEL